MRLELGVDPGAWDAALAARARRVANASYRALNSTAQAVQTDLKKVVQSTFFQPTPWILNSTTIDWARREKQEARVTFRDRRLGNIRSMHPRAALQVQVEGGSRAQKRSERRISALAGRQIWMMPARFAQLDRYGNPNVGQLVKILSTLGVLERGDNRKKGKRSRGKRRNEEYFAIFGKGEGFNSSGDALAPGIYYRNAAGRALPVYFFMRKAPQYRRRLAWQATAMATVKRVLAPAFAAELAKVQ